MSAFPPIADIAGHGTLYEVTGVDLKLEQQGNPYFPKHAATIGIDPGIETKKTKKVIVTT
jgi:hypothetical protein